MKKALLAVAAKCLLSLSIVTSMPAHLLARLYRTGEVAEIYKKWFGPLGEPSGVLVIVYVLNAVPE